MIMTSLWITSNNGKWKLTEWCGDSFGEKGHKEILHR